MTTTLFDGLHLALARLRTDRHLTRAQVAARARICRTRIARYESGEVVPHLATLERLLEAMEASFLELAARLEQVRSRRPAEPRREARREPDGYLLVPLAAGRDGDPELAERLGRLARDVLRFVGEDYGQKRRETASADRPAAGSREGRR